MMGLTEFSLAGTTAIVTGAGRGLGKAMAIGLASCGANVVLAARTVEELNAVQQECAAFGVGTLVVPTDITLSDQTDHVVEEAIKRFGSVETAICNAAAGIHGPAETMPNADWNKVIAVSLTGYFNVARSAGRQMIRQGNGGSIVAVSANSSEVGYSELTAAASAKGAVDQMCRNLAVEWGHHGIRVNSVNPGYTEHVPGYGDVSPGAGEDLDAGIRMMTPLGRRGRVPEFVWPVVFLASGASSYITGVNIRIDGGYAIK
jgi:NAD(P)-dependent dehydrogenase (short-subunit alcohol dehydrogenase family)